LKQATKQANKSNHL